MTARTATTGETSRRLTNHKKGKRTMTLEITESIAAKVLATVDAGLCAGVGKPEAGKMCVEAAVCFALGLPHGDNPPCVGASVRAGKIRLNDATWSSDEARARGLRRVAIAQLGSVDLDQVDYSKRMAEKTTRVIVPIALRAAAKRVPKHAEALEAAALRCEQEGTLESAINARDVARSAYAADAAAAAAAYAATAYAAAADAAYAAYAAADADAAAAYAATAATAAAAAAYAAYARDHVLGLSAELMTQVLIEMKSPGAAFLFLAPIEAVETVP
jgi:hypothetical protein